MIIENEVFSDYPTFPLHNLRLSSEYISILFDTADQKNVIGLFYPFVEINDTIDANYTAQFLKQGDDVNDFE
ncbi:MAG: hypothetical protein QXV17_01520 [Candidatus Micrarchaeaceae archaeon]